MCKRQGGSHIAVIYDDNVIIEKSTADKTDSSKSTKSSSRLGHRPKNIDVCNFNKKDVKLACIQTLTEFTQMLESKQARFELSNGSHVNGIIFNSVMDVYRDIVLKISSKEV